jgi:hypothetical protein
LGIDISENEKKRESDKQKHSESEHKIVAPLFESQYPPIFVDDPLNQHFRTNLRESSGIAEQLFAFVTPQTGIQSGGIILPSPNGITKKQNAFKFPPLPTLQMQEREHIKNNNLGNHRPSLKRRGTENEEHQMDRPPQRRRTNEESGNDQLIIPEGHILHMIPTVPNLQQSNTTTTENDRQKLAERIKQFLAIAKLGELDNLKSLLDQEIVMAEDENGDTMCHKVVTDLLDTAILDILCEKGAAINKPNQEGNTPLHIAAMSPSRYVKKILSLGGDPTLRNSDNMTPEELAFKDKIKKIFEEEKKKKS